MAVRVTAATVQVGAEVMCVISATLGAAQIQSLVGLPRNLCGKGGRGRSLMLETSTERGLVTACLSRNERKRLSNKRKQQGWLP